MNRNFKKYALYGIIFGLSGTLACISPKRKGILKGKVTAVTDGDTIHLLHQNESIKIRLAEIDAPEKDQPYGDRAKTALSEKISGKVVEVSVIDHDQYGRPVGRVSYQNRCINCEMLAEGHAWVYRDFLRDRELLTYENEAKTAKRGLWTLQEDQRIEPWLWRKNQSKMRQKKKTEQVRTMSNQSPPDCLTIKYCKDFKSCEEAQHYLRTCQWNHLDGDQDQIPCEKLCAKR